MHIFIIYLLTGYMWSKVVVTVNRSFLTSYKALGHLITGSILNLQKVNVFSVDCSVCPSLRVVFGSYIPVQPLQCGDRL